MPESDATTTEEDGDDEIGEWHDHEVVDWDADEDAELEFSTLYEHGAVHLRTEVDDTFAEIESNRGRVRFSVAESESERAVEISVEGNPDDVEQFGEQLIFAAKAARNGRDGNVR